jgi:hypothetical protein
MMLAIGPRCRFLPEMITMATLRSNPTPYGAFPNTERVKAVGGEVPGIGSDSPAAEVIGKRDRVTVTLSWFRAESEDQRATRGGIDWDRVRELAARSQHNGIDWDHLVCPSPRSQHNGVDWDLGRHLAAHSRRDGVDWDCARDHRERTP